MNFPLHDQTRALIQKILNCDAATSAFIQRQLQAIEARVYETYFGPLKADRLIPIEMIPAGAQEWGYDRVTTGGMARWAAPNSRDQLLSHMVKERVVFQVAEIHHGYEYTVADLEAAAMAGTALDNTLAMASRRAVDSFRNRVMLSGDAQKGFTGFINDATIASGNALFPDWDGASSTPDQIIQAMLRPLDVIRRRVRENENLYPDTLVLPITVHGYISSTPRSTTSDTTILQYFLRNQTMIKNIEVLEELETGGAGGTGRAIYYRKDPEVVVAKVGVLFETRPVQEIGFTLFTPTRARMGGTHWRSPVAAQYVDNLITP